jgi:hypothetical protein
MSATDGANEDRPKSTIDETALAHQVYEAWEKKAAFWDEMMGEGNAFQRDQRTGLDLPYSLSWEDFVGIPPVLVARARPS